MKQKNSEENERGDISLFLKSLVALASREIQKIRCPSKQDITKFNIFTFKLSRIKMFEKFKNLEFDELCNEKDGFLSCATVLKICPDNKGTTAILFDPQIKNMKECWAFPLKHYFIAFNDSSSHSSSVYFVASIMNRILSEFLKMDRLGNLRPFDLECLFLTFKGRLSINFGNYSIQRDFSDSTYSIKFQMAWKSVVDLFLGWNPRIVLPEVVGLPILVKDFYEKLKNVHCIQDIDEILKTDPFLKFSSKFQIDKTNFAIKFVEKGPIYENSKIIFRFPPKKSTPIDMKVRMRKE